MVGGDVAPPRSAACPSRTSGRKAARPRRRGAASRRGAGWPRPGSPSAARRRRWRASRGGAGSRPRDRSTRWRGRRRTWTLMRTSGARGVHRRAAAALVAQLIDDGVLDLERPVVWRRRRACRRVDRQLLGPSAPIDGAHAVIERLRRRRRRSWPAARGCGWPRATTGRRGRRPRACPRTRRRRARGDVRGAERTQLVGDQRLERLGAGGEELHG